VCTVENTNTPPGNVLVSVDGKGVRTVGSPLASSAS